MVAHLTMLNHSENFCVLYNRSFKNKLLFSGFYGQTNTLESNLCVLNLGKVEL